MEHWHGIYLMAYTINVFLNCKILSENLFFTNDLNIPAEFYFDNKVKMLPILDTLEMKA